MLTIDFDETIESSLPADELWYLITDAFENPDASPVWPVQLDAVDVERLREGATVTGSYQIGALAVQARYRVTSLDPGRAFSYESEPTHPLDGGATVAVEPRDDGTSALRWSGTYRPRNYLTGIPAVLYVRLGFLPTFFPRLETKLRAYEARRSDTFDETPVPPGAPGRAEATERRR
ncbi:MAG: SRPBCC family protein [Bradymonadaceae bacterium]